MPADQPPDSAQRDPDWWEARYLSGDLPWDTGITPPEVVQLVASGMVKAGWALDLGCGSGVTSRFLAANGFRTIGLDLSLAALRRGAARAAAEGLSCAFLRASVADLAFLQVDVTLAVDVGCFHSLSAHARQTYIHSLADRVVRGGYYLLYGFVCASPAGEDGDGPCLACLPTSPPLLPGLSCARRRTEATGAVLRHGSSCSAPKLV